MAIMNRKEKFLVLLDKMNLTDKYPQKLSLRDAMTIRQETLGTVHSTDQLAVLPYLVLQKMMMCDQRCRSCLYKMSTSTKPTSSDSDSDDIDDNRLHPVDCMLIILHCCDDILRHELFSKLSLCQLAIPFLLPSPTDNTVTFLLWAMRSLVKSWKCHETGGKEHRIVDYQGPIVSFLRIGNSPSSKSEILNAVIGGELFCCREYEGGDYKRCFVDGLVEMCCYFPSGEDFDYFTDAVIFLNLRGDAQQHSEQAEFLHTISFMSVVLIAKENINDNTMKALQSLAAVTESGEIVLLLDEEVSQTEAKEYDTTKLELLHQALPESRCVKVELKNKDKATIAEEIRKALRAKIDIAPPDQFKSINDCYEAAYEAEFKVDEEDEDCKFGKWNANVVIEKLRSAEFNKDKILPLQGPSLWQQWAKEQHCIEENKAASTTAQIDDAEKMEIRKKQFDICTKQTPVMDSFIRFLMDKNAKARRYFLQWLKLLLDDHSREILPKLLAEYQETRANLSAASSQANQPKENLHTKELTKKLKFLNEKLINASFGLEHLFREMGQIYEARMDSGGYEVPQTLKNKANHFSRIMAEIMDEGHALELMDGDASHVPTLWVLAVIEKLKAVCGKNAREKNGGKIFVLSVLGIQSTGKSTLLNTMFGLRFNVSAGRCTRGAYIQLLPLNNSLRQMIDCDYVLIIDTEGLRAPELQLEGLKHDNELATFVIGLADATIINVSSETPGDLDDILQTSLHAFIRMREKKVNPSCVFVHQNFRNVTSVTSRLDAMTQVFAKVENCEGQYNSFNQVIAFGGSNDVFYFPSLWEGDPPMAPINIGYSESAQTLKTALLERKQTYRCSLETFKLRTKDLWSAVVQNSLEVSVYNEIEIEYAKWCRMLKSEITKWKNTTKERINNCDPKNERIKEVSQMCFSDAEEMLNTTYKEVLENMKTFFNESSYSNILSQWEKKTEERIKEIFDKSKKQAKSYCDGLERIKVVSTDIESLQQNKLSVCVRQLVYKSERDDVQYNEVELEESFEAKWKEWLEYFSGEIGEIVTDDDPLQKLHQKKDSCLTEFKSKYEKLREDREKIRKFCGLLKDSFEEDVQPKIVDEIQRDQPILTNKSACNIHVLKDLANKNDFDSYVKYLFNTSECFCEWIKTYIEKHCSSETITGPAQDALSGFIKCVTDAINSLHGKNITDMDTWINELVNRLEGVLSLSQPKIGGLVGLCDAKEFSTDFPEIFEKMTVELEKKYSDKKSILDHRDSSPVKTLQKRLIGCFEMCPLCNEICQHTSAGHSGDHSVKVHRPACLGGNKWLQTYKLLLLTCTEVVHDELTYQSSENELEFSQYRNWYPCWNIPALSHCDPKYWKWFICKYKDKLVAVLDAKGADIPEAWPKITEPEAISSLDYMY